jgi:putative NADPH-quinone reductase
MTKITIIQGHPDASVDRFCHALASAYADGARDAHHEVRIIEVASLDFPLLRTRADFEHGTPPPAIAEAQRTIAWAEHVVIIFPLWLGDVPALLKGFLEQVLRPGFAFRYREKGLPEKLLRGRSARLVVTMGMPGFFYELFFRAHSVKSLERNILGFVGFGPVRRTIMGMVESEDRKRNVEWLARVHELGMQAR